MTRREAELLDDYFRLLLLGYKTVDKEIQQRMAPSPERMQRELAGFKQAIEKMKAARRERGLK